ncbi:MAG: GNAT family N-acetyltransferase [Candidatus Reconcilbacillus cellulovorans]|uniref:GNAT family N-acetyltransferase n=1 Tax=Candidatus Reconcilbacillus cellulovorans TaxID=1906605 RepID=A0A2A6E3Q4_9BACL|nr:MAG: GNAT family N-acetyltransferase [Candidatus Reconcilbacillus cellulovorans]
MKIRSFRLADYVQASELFREVLSEACFEETMKAFGRQLAWDSDLILVAEVDGKVVGAIIGTIDEDEGFYYRIAVAREHQRKGIGTALIQALRNRFLQRRVRRIRVTVDAHNAPVLPLYEAAGYGPKDFFHSWERLKIVSG